MDFVDTHCHLDMADYGPDLAEVLASARAAQVRRIITIGIDLASSRAAVALAAKEPGIFAAVGVHPHNTMHANASDYEELARLASHPKVVAYGEIGLDMVKQHSPVEVQEKHLRLQLRLARDLNLPLIIHDREAHAPTLAMLRQEGPFAARGVWHCFSGDPHLARQVLDLGFFISIPGIVTYNKADAMQEVARTIPLSALLLETDGPFLAPVPRRGRRNEPGYLLYTAAKVAELRGISLPELARATSENAELLFGLPELANIKSGNG